MKVVVFILIGLFANPLWAKSFTYTDAHGVKNTWSVKKLLMHKQLVNIKNQNTEAFPGAPQSFKAIALHHLINSKSDGKADQLKFSCTDGYSKVLSKKVSTFMRSKLSGPTAFLAIEDPKNPWPDLAGFHKGKHRGSAGPFLIFWRNEGTRKMKDQPWSVVSLQTVKSDPAEAIKPTNASLIATKGHKLFVKTCFACHTINLKGEGSMGPDLNYPESPIEYFGKARLKRYIRNPDSVRIYKSGRMKGFNKESLSDSELESIIIYLQHMAKNRP